MAQRQEHRRGMKDSRHERARRTPQAVTHQAPSGTCPAQVKIRGPWKWVLRVALLLFTPLLLAVIAEGALRVFGYGSPTTFFVKSPKGDAYITNEKFGRVFFGRETALKPLLFTIPVKKAPGTIRICILGESAAMGTPDPAFSFGRILEVQLRHLYPEKQFEVLNAAMRGINSYIIRTIASECAAHEVDLFMIYMGNNEAIGFHSPDPGTAGWRLSLPLLRASDWLRTTRLGQLFLALADRRRGDAPIQDMAYFRAHRIAADDPRQARLRRNFRANLEDICRAAAGAGARVLLCSVPVNLKDCPPLGSLHRDDLKEADQRRWDELYRRGVELETNGRNQEAVDAYLSAMQIDSHFAELNFRLARCYFALGATDRARTCCVLARDWDALQFRTDSEVNKLIRQKAAHTASSGMELVDLENEFAKSALSDRGIPGERLFLDHVHPTFAGNYLIATNCIPRLAAALRFAPPGNLLTQKECEDALAYTPYHDVNVIAAMVRLTSVPPFTDQLDHARHQSAAEAQVQKRLASFSQQDADLSLTECRAAVEKTPTDWLLRFNLASLCLELGRYREAEQFLRPLVDQYPQHSRFRLNLAAALAKAGDKAGALAQLDELLREDPDEKNARDARHSLTRTR